jgi:hypothetical protein
MRLPLFHLPTQPRRVRPPLTRGGRARGAAHAHIDTHTLPNNKLLTRGSNEQF